MVSRKYSTDCLADHALTMLTVIDSGASVVARLSPIELYYGSVSELFMPGLMCGTHVRAPLVAA